MNKSVKQIKYLQAVDCVIFGFDGKCLKTLLIKRNNTQETVKWSLMGGFVQQNEHIEQASSRILKQLMNLDNVYMEQLMTFGDPNRDPVERTFSTAYFVLIDLTRFRRSINANYNLEWFSLSSLPQLIFDHGEMVDFAIKELRYKSALCPLLFELLPKRFTLPQLHILYESVYKLEFDKRNFARRILEMGLLIKQTEKEKLGSKKGAFYYQLNLQNYYSKFRLF